MIKKILIPCFLFTGIVAQNAWASGEGIYLSIGATYANLDLDDVTQGSTTYTPDENNAAGGSFGFGYNTSDHLAIEVGGLIFNDVDYSNGSSGSPTRSTSAGYIDIKPMIAYKSVNAFLRLGTAYVYAQNKFSNGNDETITHSFEPLYGAGFGINFTPNFEIDLSGNHIQSNDTPITYGQLEFTYHFVPKYTPGGFLIDD